MFAFQFCCDFAVILLVNVFCTSFCINFVVVFIPADFVRRDFAANLQRICSKVARCDHSLREWQLANGTVICNAVRGRRRKSIL